MFSMPLALLPRLYEYKTDLDTTGIPFHTIIGDDMQYCLFKRYNIVKRQHAACGIDLE